MYTIINLYILYIYIYICAHYGIMPTKEVTKQSKELEPWSPWVSPPRASPKTLKAYEENNWILWALQPWTQFNSSEMPWETMENEKDMLNLWSFILFWSGLILFFGSMAFRTPSQLNMFFSLLYCDTHCIRNCWCWHQCEQTHTQ